jgi:hypothetical protein
MVNPVEVSHPSGTSLAREASRSRRGAGLKHSEGLGRRFGPAFSDRGLRTLKGVLAKWRLFAVEHDRPHA